MVNYWFIDGDFYKERSKRIGASDVPALISDPENPTESLSGYGRTPITVWLEKTGKKDREAAGLPAEIGHHMENKALEIFIRGVFDVAVSKEFIRNKILYECLNDTERSPVIEFQHKLIKHNTQYYDDVRICHPDAVYVGGMSGKKRAFGLNIDLSKPFLIEAKSATLWSAKRPAGSMVKGYDFDLKTWQGIPLKHYMQIQYQLDLFQIDTCYLPLLCNTSEFYVWEIKANKKHQEKIRDIVYEVSDCINSNTPPKDLAICLNDIKSLYPEIKDDYTIISGEEKSHALEIAKTYKEAERQEKKWKAKKEEALDSMSVILKDNKEIRDDTEKIASWITRKGSERVLGLKELKERDDKAYSYLKRKGLITQSDDSRFVKIYYNEEECV
ncbi:MAG: hypothetical protein EHM12_08180 [Dehalococcoidia bacterium]|nr:MAG: hypothetical protein EHM12_08180 [Dehalococcoidia bacterium]